MRTNEPNLYRVPRTIRSKWASPENPSALEASGGQSNGGRKGSPSWPLKAGEKRVLAHEEGVSGIVRRIWITINDRSPKMLRGIRLEIRWDGSERPAVSCPIGDFFGMGLGRTAPFQSALFSSPEGRSFNCFVPMPFRSGMRITVENETDVDLLMFYYDVDYTVGDDLSADDLYFHAYFNRESPTSLRQDYEILPSVKGRGRFLGTNIGVIANQERYFKTWWGEGEIKIYLDEDGEFPSLCGTGTEDYIGTGWGQGVFDQLYQGSPIADQENMEFCFYRYHIPDPVYFASEIRVAIQQIGNYGPGDKAQLLAANLPLERAGVGAGDVDIAKETYKLFERQDDWSSCAYFYLDRPDRDSSDLLPLEKRLEGLKGNRDAELLGFVTVE